MMFAGVRVVGFGEELTAAQKKDRTQAVLLDSFFGVAAGATLGRLVKKGVGTAVGAAVGGAGVAALSYVSNTPSTEAPKQSGLGQVDAVTTVVGASPWAVALATSVLGAATGWVLEEVATHVRRRRRR